MVSGFANRKETCAICKYWSEVGATKFDPKTQRFEYDSCTQGYCAMKKNKISGFGRCKSFQKDYRFL